MAKVHFAPFCAIMYVGAEDKVFNTSLARPKPTLANGDIIIVDKVTAFNLVKKGFGEFKDVDSIDLSEDGTASAALKDENEKLKQELLVALASLAEAPTDALTEAPTDAPTEAPTDAPTEAPTDAPTEAPTDAPTEAPTDAPTEAPTVKNKKNSGN